MSLEMVMAGEVEERMRMIRAQRWQLKMCQNVRAVTRELLNLCVLDAETSGTAAATVRWALSPVKLLSDNASGDDDYQLTCTTT
jgi:hypothetical protein